MVLSEDLSGLATEAINQSTLNLDCLTTIKMVEAINREDIRVANVVTQALPQIASAIDAISIRMGKGGRLIYMGAGTSGRLGVLDASECPPTFNVSPELVIGIVAGGDVALREAVEEAEDKADCGIQDLKNNLISPLDSIVGLTASGRTPYVIGGLSYARSIGALAISIACNSPAEISSFSDIAILAPVGPEVITGSTRLKAGTAQKMILNMISTGVMVKLGKTYGNLMVDVRPTNAKLRIRAARIVQQICHVSLEEAEKYLVKASWQVKPAIVMASLSCSYQEAIEKLDQENGHIRKVITPHD
ncbi:MAG TPA: N-acetylmuramic acid 6-phosphate etherase [Anaerolineaceae bacterium]|nr:N-acetylmuramic acid 6-phosphate etherase [Anaerolineaceae bacterium]HPN52342.1 N-acetylmuramic acid 6-phosphate etherase [Anaerolineaceae bacterium]